MEVRDVLGACVSHLARMDHSSWTSMGALAHEALRCIRSASWLDRRLPSLHPSFLSARVVIE
jgi:hypothetical protein